MDYNTFEINPRESIYHIVKFYDVEDKAVSLHCVPSCWIKWQDNDSTTVLMAYPDEPHEVTKQRVKNYETPNDNWTLFFAEIMYSSDFYHDAINYIEARKNAEKHNSEVSMEIGSPQCSVPNSSFNSGEYESAFLLEFEEEIDRQLNSNPQSLVVNTIDEIINSKLEISKFEMDQEDIYEFKEEYLDQPFMAFKTNGNESTLRKNLAQRNNLLGAAENSRQTDEKWTLKHKVYSSGLVELMPNSGVYIEETELRNGLETSKTCSSLTRHLTANIFSEFALRKCTYLGNRKGDRDNRLNRNAVQTIVNFVREHEYKRNSRVVNIATIESAIRYQMTVCKKDYQFHIYKESKI